MSKKVLWTFIFGTYGIFLIFLIVRKKILFFLHPDFLPMVYGSVIILFLLAIGSMFFSSHKHEHDIHTHTHTHTHTHEHVQKLAWYHVVLLLIPLFIGFGFDLRPLSSMAALERGLDTGALTLGRRQIQSSGFQSSPAKRTLYQWIIALSNNPEPSRYLGQEVHIKGFAINDPSLPPDQLMIARFIVTCCAADARVLSLPLKRTLPELSSIKNDTWIEVTGKMAVREVGGESSVIIDPQAVKMIPEPDNPYEL